VDKYSEYGRIYNEITRGFTKEIVYNQTFYFKHPSLSEHFNIYGNYDLIILDAKKRGLQSEPEKIQEAISEGWWTKEKESEINILNKTISNLIKTKNKLLIPSQKNSIDAQIKRTEAILLTYIKERNQIVGFTAEKYAYEKFLDEMVILLTYKDENLKDQLFDSNDYYNLSDEHVEKIRDVYSKQSILFSLHNLKCVAATGFFQNLVYLNEDAYSFWGKPTTSCTKYQIDLLLYGKMFKNLIKNYSENGKPIGEEVQSDPEKFIQWVENQSSDRSKSPSKNKKSRSDGKHMVSSYVGATNEDLNKLGVKVEKLEGKSLLDLASEKGGTIEKHDYLRAREKP
jgi:hypothetical protein